MTLRRVIARTISEFFAGAGLFSPPRTGLRVLMYHAIGSPALGDTLGLFSLSPALFREQMEHLARHHTAQLVSLSPDISVKPELQIAISFDDGYLDNLRVAAPILAELGLPFTVFVTSDFVRERRPGFLNPGDLRELAAMPGVSIGAHGATHVALSACDDTKLRNELVLSRQYLEDEIGHSVLTMAYPYGATNCRVRNAAETAGYRLAASSYATINDVGRDRLMLGRTEIVAPDTLRVFRQKLKGDWDWYRWRAQDPASI